MISHDAFWEPSSTSATWSPWRIEIDLRFEAEGKQIGENPVRAHAGRKVKVAFRKVAADGHPSARRTCVVQHGVQVLDSTYLWRLGLGHRWSLRRLR